MMHPDTELRFVSKEIGYGVFATRPIPIGTIVYVKDQLEVEITHEQYARLDSICRNSVDKYTYMDRRGVRILSWDYAKYVNHRCECNSISTAYGFEIAIRDISAGEEITDEYGLFNITEPMSVNCGCSHCRNILLPDDIDTYHPLWDEWVVGALAHVRNVKQPLWNLLDVSTKIELMNVLTGCGEYLSVIHLKWIPEMETHN